MSTPLAPASKAKLYLTLAVDWTWLFWFIVIARARPFSDPHGMTLFMAGAAGVPGAAFLLLLTIDDQRAGATTGGGWSTFAAPVPSAGSSSRAAAARPGAAAR